MPVLELRGITKIFPGVVANDDVSLALEPGEIVALLGENGAGKTTLMNVVYGLLSADGGEVYVDGKPAKIKSPRDAIDLGIGMVHQHFMLVEPLTVTENIVLGREPGRFGVIDFPTARERVRALSEQYGLKVDPDAKIQDLSVGMQQRVEILKALYQGARVLILDEPTAVLTPQEVHELFSVVRSLVDEGLSVVFITHKLEEVMAVADRIVVMRDGRVVGETKPAETDMVGLARMMVGRDVVLRIEKGTARCGEPVLQVEDLRVRDDRRLEAVRGVTFEICGGEVVALAGVDGNGQRELVEAIVGLRRPESGSIRLKGRDVTHASARDAIEAKISHIPEDRHRRGLVLDFTIAENLVLGDHREEPYATRGIMRPAVIAQMARERIEAYDVRTPSERVLASALSGGNQQKVVVAREIGRDPELLVAAQPTRGLDVGAIEFVHRQIIAQRDAGKGVLLVSFELEEVMALADRILVIYEGRIVKEFAAGEADDETLGYYMTGGGGSKLEPAAAQGRDAGGER
ncbi:ABC transporter ATP-binding protein [Parvivirga hydrogeniphila]|uniref:ABC transporter ATP-binding protein n=1 Tax=Parvivirga hydrogeniphila TaxID=2939460 RepID=UPI002B27A3F6|nr:ABC transporter ATP-binding protein [Parvivirga hydrogeniphila]